MKQAKAKRRSNLVRIDQLDQFCTFIDVRTPTEYAKDHIPNAINCPVLSNEEHTQVGTLYKQESPFIARKVGAAMVARNIAALIESQFAAYDKNWHPLIYCWRGGQRSESMLTVLRQIGWRACKLEGGYKSWRHHVICRLNELPSRFSYRVLTGLTGSGKSYLLEALAAKGAQVLHLEKLAGHKGSVLGGHPDFSQPSQAQFESKLLTILEKFDPALPVFIESENRKIGSLYLPENLSESISRSSCIELKAPLEVRVEFLTRDYAWVVERREWLEQQLQRIANLHPKERVKQWQNWIQDGEFMQLTADLLEQHYDPLYQRSHRRHLNSYDAAQKIELKNLQADTLANLAQQLLDTVAMPSLQAK